jgi:DNA-directed RNA polymerase subunit RPC12/RpoP
METIKDYFLCDKCKSKNFSKIYNFSTQFRRVNFSDDFIDDKVIEEIYQCTNCHKTFSKQQIEIRLMEITDDRLKSLGAPEKKR